MDAREPLVVRNDWGVLEPPALSGWEPTRSVSVVVPAYDCHTTLPLTLAALARQTYPSGLLEVVVVDDGSRPELVLPEVRPANCRLVRADDHADGWGPARARDVGVTVSDGEIVHWLDADLIPFPEHVAAQARWHHLLPDAVTLGYKRFVPEGRPPVAEVVRRAEEGTLGGLFPPERAEPHTYVEELIAATDGLRTADHLVYRAHVGATGALRRELYLAAGRLDTGLRQGEDSEFGYRLAQAGAVFIPEPQADGWHLGPSLAMRDAERIRRYNRPHLADRMPLSRWLRDGSRRIWSVPLVVAVVRVDGQPLERVRACVDRLLASDEYDLRVHLVGPWSAVTEQRQPVLEDPWLEPRLIAATYRSDPRVVLVEDEPETVFPAPYLLRVPVSVGVSPGTVRRLLTEADTAQVGLLRVVPAGAGPGGTPPAVELWRTAAVHRARWVRRPGESLARAVARVHGAATVRPATVGLRDLAGRTGAELARAAADPPPPTTAGPPPEVVEVAGLRSLLRATGLVARLATARARRAVRAARYRVPRRLAARRHRDRAGRAGAPTPARPAGMSDGARPEPPVRPGSPV